MGLFSVILIAIGVSMDAFAVSICKGLGMKPFRWKYSLIIAAFFGGFQALMPLIGWLIGSQFQQYIVDFDHWVAFGLLLFVGGKMLIESFHKEETSESYSLNMKELLLLSIATSIDALAVGISFSLLKPNHLFLSFFVIGITTFAFSIAGSFIGHKFGNRYQQPAEIIGGIILIGIGVKIILEHLLV
mgnify:CR=1 FL=1